MVVIFLGIFWLNTNRGCKEGVTDMAALSNDILNTVNDKLAAADVDVGSYMSALPGAIDQITAIVEQEAAMEAAAAGTSPGTLPARPASMSTVIDTTGSDYYNGKTFFTGKRFSDGFCQTYSDPVARNNQCSALTTENCNQTDCCVVLNGTQCVAGDAAGPTYKTDANGDDIDFAY